MNNPNMVFHPPNALFTATYRKFLHRLVGGTILLLTTCGRRTGKPHTVGLQYELIEDCYYLGAADGAHADWYRNILKNNEVIVQTGNRVFLARAEVVTDAVRIANFLAYRLKKHPVMIRSILRLDSIKGKITHQVLEEYAGKIRLVILIPVT